MRKLAIVVSLLVAAGLTLVAAGALADKGKGNGNGGGNNFRASLNGYNEVVGGPGASTGSVSTTGRGRLTLRIFDNRIHYVLDYSNLSGGTTSASHIHFAQQHVGGGVSAFLCGGGGKPTCTNSSGHIEGDIDATNVIGPTDQGIAPGEFGELVSAIRAGATYANVHTTPSYPEGEIRGQILRRHGNGDGGQKSK
ncbi:MAG: CHRD domain-containing protein [Actinomycetota bacterium]|nr:CHRD domain-containing protein [Actinomycetota bacterium]